MFRKPTNLLERVLESSFNGCILLSDIVAKLGVKEKKLQQSPIFLKQKVLTLLEGFSFNPHHAIFPIFRKKI